MEHTDEKMQLEGKWGQVKGRVRETWGEVSDDDLDRTRGNWEQLVGTIKEKTGQATDEIEQRLRGMLD